MRTQPLIISTLLVAVFLGFSSAHAQPPENRGKPEAHGKHDQHPGKGEHGGEDDRRYQRAEDHAKHDRYDEKWDRRDISIEEALIREIFRDERRYIETSRGLPPGIQKNLARGKPMPPGIAKKFDQRVHSRLPQYPGYDWRQVGTDAVLVHVTTGIIEAIIADVLR